tara:strand:+ start:30 stop:641 length:612 start_codon:yes stop_codon:yes gene_type:complete
MPKISSYTTTAPASGDLLIGSDVNASPTNSTKNFTVSSVLALGTPVTQVLDSSSVVDQVVGDLGAITKVKFGSAASNSNISIDDLGNITFLVEGNYLIENTFNVGQISASGVAVPFSLSYGGFVNEIQAIDSKTYRWDIAANQANHYNTKSDTFIFQATANDILYFGFEVNSVGATGTQGLGASVAGFGLSEIPSSQIKIYKI